MKNLIAVCLLSLAGTLSSAEFDFNSPTVSINQSAMQADPAVASPIFFTVRFSEPVSGFTAADVVLSGTAGATTAFITGQADHYTVAVSGMTTNGTVIAAIPAGRVRNAAGYINTASSSWDNGVIYRGYPSAPPSVTVNQAEGQEDPTTDSLIHFSLEFSEPVFDFEPLDIVLSGTAAPTSLLIIETGLVVRFVVGGMSQNGTVIASIPAGRVWNAFGDFNTASTSTDNVVTYESIGPNLPEVVINQASSQADPTSNAPIQFTVVFNRRVTDLAPEDVRVEGTAGATDVVVTGQETNFNVYVRGMVRDGTVVASIPAGRVRDYLGNPNAASTSLDNTVHYFLPPPPRLSVLANTNRIVLTWPTNDSAYKLYYTPQLPAAGWIPSALIPSLQGATYSVNEVMAGAARFYRLQK